MTDLPSPVHLVDAVLALTVVEGFFLAIWHRRTGRGVAPADYALNLLSGLCLMAALRLGLAGAALPWLLLALSAAGLAHAADLWRRWNGVSPS